MIKSVTKLWLNHNEIYDLYTVSYQSGKKHEYLSTKQNLPSTIKLFIDKAKHCQLSENPDGIILTTWN